MPVKMLSNVLKSKHRLSRNEIPQIEPRVSRHLGGFDYLASSPILKQVKVQCSLYGVSLGRLGPIVSGRFLNVRFVYSKPA